MDSWNAGFEGFLPAREYTEELVSRWRADLDGPDTHVWWLAELDHVGFAGVRPSRDPDDPAVGELDTIAVAPSSWRLGIGAKLMSAAIDRLTDDGYREAVLWTLAGYERGHRFYTATGWSTDGVSRDEGREVCYRRRLRWISASGA